MSGEHYDLAISFAGEERELAREIAQRLQAIGFSIFFDEYEKAQLWGADLTEELGRIYGEAARYCLLVISSSYVAKPWTNHERQFALAKALQNRQAYVLPLRTDDSVIPGLPPTVGYIDLRNTSVAEVVSLLVAKLGSPLAAESGEGSDVSRDAIQSVLAACYRRAVFTRFHAQLSDQDMMQSLSECRVSLQKIASFVRPAEAQKLVSGIIGELDLIERVLNKPFTWDGSGTPGMVDQSKIRIVNSLHALSGIAELPISFPSTLTEELIRTADEANSAPVGPPSSPYDINECGGFRG